MTVIRSVLGLVATFFVVIPTCMIAFVAPMAWPLKVLLVVAVWVAVGLLIQWIASWSRRGFTGPT